MAMYIKTVSAIGLLGAAIGLSGCGSNSHAAATGAGKPTLKITAPSDGATVRLPVTLRFTTNEPIGPEESGKDHVHVVIDGKTDQYTVVTSTTYQIKNLPAGRHVIGVTLQHADHSPVGVAAQVTVTVAGGSGNSGNTGTGNGSGNGGSRGGPYDY